MSSEVTQIAHRTPRKARPRRYSVEIASEICARLMLGESLNLICGDPAMPTARAVVYWLADPKMSDFHEQYHRARQVQAEMRVDQMFDIINDDSEDYITVLDKKGREVVRPNHENVQRAKLRVDTIKWFASKLAPKIYGERVTSEHDVTGDLADLLKGVSNRTNGLPEPVSEQ